MKTPNYFIIRDKKNYVIAQFCVLEINVTTAWPCSLAPTSFLVLHLITPTIWACHVQKGFYV